MKACEVNNINDLYLHIRSYKISVIDSYMLVDIEFSLQRLGFNLTSTYMGYLRTKCRLCIFFLEFLCLVINYPIIVHCRYI
jgi:hypothetical protein